MELWLCLSASARGYASEVGSFLFDASTPQTMFAPNLHRMGKRQSRRCFVWPMALLCLITFSQISVRLAILNLTARAYRCGAVRIVPLMAAGVNISRAHAHGTSG